MPIPGSGEVIVGRKVSLQSRLLDLARRFLHRAEVDRAVVFMVLARTWALAASPVTFFLIVSFLTAEAQGYYFTFGSLLALQSFAELGFSLAIIQFASHEWARLKLDETGRITGEPAALSRLVSLGRLVFKWYAVASGLFVVALGLAGYVFFSLQHDPDVAWVSPWVALVVLAGLNLLMLPMVALLEGCNQVANVNLFRLIQGVVSPLAMWLVLLLGGGLWIAPAAVGVGVLSNLALLSLRYPRFFQPFLRPLSGAGMSWRTEIWPMQSRLAVSGIAGFFAFSLFTPVMFHYHGAVVAGQMGMTLTLIAAIGSIAMAWVQAKVPFLGTLIANKEYNVLDRRFFRISAISLAVISCGAVGVWGVVYLLYLLQYPFAQRLLSPLPTGLFLLAAVLLQISQCESAYLRAHKREPIMVMSAVSCLVIGLLVWVLGRSFGPTGAAAAYLGTVAILILPWQTAIWLRCRALWHQV
jgi:O-antigen/teichoic acid export membrane protein